MESYSPNAIEETAKTFYQKKYKDRFLVRLGNHIHSIKTDDIALFYAEGRTVFLMTATKKKFILDYKLEDLTSILSTQSIF